MLWKTLTFAFGMLVPVTVAWCEEGPGPAPQDQPEWLRLIVAILLVACVGAGSFMSSKRGHMD